MRQRAHRLRALARLRCIVEAEAELRGGMGGAVRPEQRPWSWLLDRIADAEQRACAA